jgi:hypothetical protein
MQQLAAAAATAAVAVSLPSLGPAGKIRRRLSAVGEASKQHAGCQLLLLLLAVAGPLHSILSSQRL